MSLRASPRLTWFAAIAASLLIVAAWAGAPQLRAQTFDATNLRQPTYLDMTWLVHAGDDPAYAQPGFDDSHWTRFNPHSSLKKVFPHSRPSVVWYRLHLKVAPDQAGLALSEQSVADAFEIYVNGKKLMRSGSFEPYVPYTYSAYLIKQIPDAAIASGSLVIALRIHVTPLEWAGGPGLYYNELMLGQKAALSDRVWLAVTGENALAWFFNFAGMGLGIVALALFTAQRDRREYLWIFLMFLCIVAQLPLSIYQIFHTIPAAWTLIDVPFQIGYVIFLTLMYLALLRIRIARWMQVLLCFVGVGQVVSAVLTLYGIGSWITVLLAYTPSAGLVAGLIPTLLFVNFRRRGNREAAILLVPALLMSLYMYFELVVYLALQIPALAGAVIRLDLAVTNWSIGPYTLQSPDLCGCLFVLSLAFIIVLRATRITHQQAVLESELAAAQQVQQVILPEQIETIPGFRVESIYQPAEQVGGDFFQVLPAGEGGMLAVVGDVAGKGLPAAMLVSMLVGTIRGVAGYTCDPAELLASLNERLVGRAEGFSTAVAALIGADGSVALAGAGHLPPYLDGKEIELPSALPLGVEKGARYQTVRLRIEAGSRLTFYSDGIVEAKKQDGEMVGFERARELSTQPAAAIVAAARRFGQQDDMTVVSIERLAAPVSAPEMALEPAPVPAT